VSIIHPTIARLVGEGFKTAAFFFGEWIGTNCLIVDLVQITIHADVAEKAKITQK
jgi:hypothetical protein